MLSLLWICCFFWRPDNKCILQVQLPPSDEKKKVIDDVNKDRRFAIDASLVRIMKSRKIMTHQNLVAECVEQLSRMFKVLHHSVLSHLCDLFDLLVQPFMLTIQWPLDLFFPEKILFCIYTGLFLSLVQPDIKMIKRRIEDLITREYLERDVDAANSYQYLAWLVDADWLLQASRQCFHLYIFWIWIA